MLETVLVVAVGVFLAGMAFLRYVAPKTATDKDDKLLEKAEKAEPIVNLLKK